MDGFQPVSQVAVQGVIGLAMRDLATRAAPARISSLVLSAHGFTMLVPAGALLLWISGGGPSLHRLAIVCLQQRLLWEYLVLCADPIDAVRERCGGHTVSLYQAGVCLDNRCHPLSRRTLSLDADWRGGY